MQGADLHRTQLAASITWSRNYDAPHTVNHPHGHGRGVTPICDRQVFNNTPDETAFYRLCLNREDVGGALTMIQPTLQSYGFDGPPTPVRPDLPHPLVILARYLVRHWQPQPQPQPQPQLSLSLCTTSKPCQAPCTSHQPANFHLYVAELSVLCAGHGSLHTGHHDVAGGVILRMSWLACAPLRPNAMLIAIGSLVSMDLSPRHAWQPS